MVTELSILGGLSLPAHLPLMRPRLPDADALLPYLRQIDQTQIYSNNGPLLQRFARRMEAHFGVSEGCELPVGSGTAGLTAALLCLGFARGGLCMVPDWTFPATLNAVFAAGLTPYLVDVDAASWALTPAIAERALEKAPGPVVAVMPVSPFGAPLPMDLWETFRRETGVAVVADTAAAFDGTVASTIPQVISLHATKAFGIGEGGLVLCRDKAFVTEVLAAITFGFKGSRVPVVHAVNGKLSEYHAAVGLAALDEWPDRRRRLWSAGKAMRAELAGIAAVGMMQGWAEGWMSNTLVVALRGETAAAALERDMARDGIETRRWWPVLMHQQALFRECPYLDAPVAQSLRDGVIGLPFMEGMSGQEIARLGRAVRRALAD
jgi:dTDP-4-amino-4,6-dideoxygalactose transaminase